jgi:hypothetical protein
MRISRGNGGWVRITLGGGHDLYLRFASAGGRPALMDVYIDGNGTEIHPDWVRDLDIGGIGIAANTSDRGWLERSIEIPGPQLSLLAQSFTTTFGAYSGRHCDKCGGPVRRREPLQDGRERALDDWIALQWLSQYPSYRISRPSKQRRRPDEEAMSAPLPVHSPDRLTDEFLSLVAANYAWANATGQRPAPLMADQARVSRRTVHAWIRKARERGLIPPSSRRTSSNV